MANQKHLDILQQGVGVWNKWRKENPDIDPDLSKTHLSKIWLREVDLSRANLRGIILRGANLREANLNSADLRLADLSWANLYKVQINHANLSEAILRGADLRRASLRGIKLQKADLRDVNLRAADLSQADLSGANLASTVIVDANLEETDLTNCSVYGISAWDVKLASAKQTGLVISRPYQPMITVDNLKVAQFIYLLLNNEEIREVVDTITSKVVLILGRFTVERKAILDALRNELRHRNYSPVVFDFEKPASRDITETVSILAHLARFVIADLTDAKSIPQELMAIVPTLPSLAVQPLILTSQHEYGMFEHFKRYPWVLPVYRYSDEASLLEALQEKIIASAEQKAKELE